MIEVQNLVKKYGERVAVGGISFTVKKGEILGFLGQNGAGKSTTMKILTGFMSATSGTAKIAGFDVFENSMEVKRRIGYLPETPPLYHELTVSEYLSFVADLRGIPRKEKASKMDAVLKRCDIADVRGRLIGNLSKGYKQRVGIAQALIHEPEVLVLDEPTVGLDPKQVAEARGLIKSLGRERTVIYSSHILSEVAASCDRVLIIDKGRLVGQEALSALTLGAGRKKTEIVLQRIPSNVVSQIQGLEGVSNVETFTNGAHRLVVESDGRDDLMAQMAKVVVTQDAGLVKMAPVQMALEEYYLSLIGGRRISE